jgi:glycosyltransferase involved in cell wall biosynthesis
MISVIIPIYKSEKFLEQAIQSVLDQTYSNLELVLVNDGSPDASNLICTDFANKDNRVVYIEQKNAGAAHAMREGFKRSKGDFIMFLDADDWVNPKTLEIANSFLSRTDCDIIFWNRIRESSDHSTKVPSFLPANELFIHERLDWIKRRAFGLIDNELTDITKFDQISSGWGKVYKRKLIENDSYCLVDENNKGNFDAEFVCRMFSHCSSIQYINEFLNHYRVYNVNSITKSHGSILFEKYKPMFNNLNNFIQKNNLKSQFQKALDNRISVSILNCILAMTSSSNNCFENYNSIKKILNDDLYVKSIANFQVTKLKPIHSLFFKLCKNKNFFLVLIFAYLIKVVKIVKKNKI